MFYKAYSTREKGWALLTTAFFINALDVESYILEPLGFNIHPEAYMIAAKIPNFFIAFLLIWGAIHLKHGGSRFKHVVYMSVFFIISYIWLILLATDAFSDPTERAILPSFALGSSLIYIGFVLKKNLISDHKVESLFPWGLMLLGALNLTYPVTRFLDWFAPIGFLLGATFRLVAAVGAIKFVFYPFKPVRRIEMNSLPPGGVLVPSKSVGDNVLADLVKRGGIVLVTRRNVEELRKALPSESLVFWVTRAKEGKLEDSPAIYAISPSRIDILTDLMAKAVEQGYRTVYLDVFEYLMVENGFENAIKFVLNVKDRIVSAGGTMFLVIDVNTLDPHQARIIKREFEEV
ncbi:DUF835 domain-containing protein [Thermococcus sp. 21S7]|uniref:DUF835 domain-containing protein n=1 Tax=Thermococcus sp. 21S7 TaxID=1638221 RepID=UPI003211DB19